MDRWLRKSRLKTFDQCAAAYINAHRASWKNPKHVAQCESTLAKYASPVFGTLPAREVCEHALAHSLPNKVEGRIGAATCLTNACR